MRYLDLRELADELEDLKQNEERELEDNDRLQALLKLEKDVGGDLADAADNEPTLIPEDEFEDYCRDFAYDVGYISDENKNPLLKYVDWKMFADDCRVDFDCVEFEGQSYLRRA